MKLRYVLAVIAVFCGGCGRAKEPALLFLDRETGLALSHPAGWRLGSAEQQGIRYRYLTAPKVGGDTTPLAVTLASPQRGVDVRSVAATYLASAKNVEEKDLSSRGIEWRFEDAGGKPSRLRLQSGAAGTFGAWASGSSNAMDRYRQDLDALFDSLRIADAGSWPEETYEGLVARVPPNWTRGSRIKTPLGSSMQFRSPPIGVDRGTMTIHGFVTVSTEPVPGAGDGNAFYKALKDRLGDTVAIVRHDPWRGGWADTARSGTAISETRVRRWIDATAGRGLVMTCESRADVFTALDGWCQRIAETIALK